MDKTYKVYWSQTGLNELSNMLAYPPEVKERILIIHSLNYVILQLSLPSKFHTESWKAIGHDLGSIK